jgi:alcohol dehydrogenase
MLLGAHLAGCAIENSMLGAAHSAANPLTALCGIVHGHAVGVMLPHVIRFNCETGQRPYADLIDDPDALATRIEHLLSTAGIPPRLSEMGVEEAKIPAMAQMAAKQWTAQFNPRPVTADDFVRLYRSAME